jgi:hypothetical protein
MCVCDPLSLLDFNYARLYLTTPAEPWFQISLPASSSPSSFTMTPEQDQATEKRVVEDDEQDMTPLFGTTVAPKSVNHTHHGRRRHRADYDLSSYWISSSKNARYQKVASPKL